MTVFQIYSKGQSRQDLLIGSMLDAEEKKGVEVDLKVFGSVEE